MDESSAGTSGGDCGASGATRRRRLLWLALGLFVFLAIQSIANVESSLDDMAKLGLEESRAHVWTWQLSSVAVWLALMPVVAWLVAHVRPPRFSWPVTVLLHALATLPVSIVHVAAMVTIRKLVYAAGGESYDFGGLAEWFYEYRKDAASYLLAVAYIAYAQWLLTRPAPATPATAEARMLLVPDGNVTHRVPVAEIGWAAAAGNYVEIAWGPRTLLHRATLAGVESALGSGFVRIHRGRLVRRDAVRSIETDRSGDFIVTLADGATLRGSRRYRSGLEGA